MNVYARVVLDEFRKRGVETTVLDEGLGVFTARIQGREHLFHESLSPFTDAPSVVLSGNKYLSNRYLGEKGFIVPKAVEVGSFEDAHRLLEERGSIVLKPIVGEGGEGVIVDISNDLELKRSYTALERQFPRIYAEETVFGNDLRMLVIDYRTVAALQRVPAHVIGDGKQTVEELVRKREQRLRKKDPKVTIPLDDETERVLIKQESGLQDVPAAGRKVTIRLTANFHTGGAIHDVTGKVSSDYMELAASIARAVQMPVLGVDLCVPEFDGSDYHIIEINERPNLAFHLHPDSGEPVDAPQHFVDFVLREARNGFEERSGS
jgi:D-alanine-D-alanine ligase-like ATP-grasp enzyme